MNSIKSHLILFVAITLVFCFCLQAKAENKPPILVGATVSLDGAYAEPSKMIQDSYRLWVTQINQQGGLLDRKVQLLLYNDHSKPELTRSLYEKLIIEDSVDLVLSPYGTPLTLAASEVTEKFGKVLIASAASTEVIWDRGYQYIFGVYALADRYYISLLDILARSGFRTVGLVYADSPFHVSVARSAEKWARRFGLDVIVKQIVEDNPAEMEQAVELLKSKDPDGVIFTAYPPRSYHFLDLLQQHGYRPRAIGMSIIPTHPDFYKKAGTFAEGIFAPSQWEPDERVPFPGTTKFIADFKAFTGRMPSYHAGSAYAACQILEKTIDEAGRIDHEQIRKYVSSLDTVSVIGRFKVDQTGRQIGHNPILIQWQNGRKEIVYPRKMKTSNPLLNHNLRR